MCVPGVPSRAPVPDHELCQRRYLGWPGTKARHQPELARGRCHCCRNQRRRAGHARPQRHPSRHQAANILVNAEGHGILADLGLARQWIDSIDENDDRRLTMPGRAIGSPAYMSPEQVNDTATVDPAADAYSLGATPYHACRAPAISWRHRPNRAGRRARSAKTHRHLPGRPAVGDRRPHPCRHDQAKKRPPASAGDWSAALRNALAE